MKPDCKRIGESSWGSLFMVTPHMCIIQKANESIIRSACGFRKLSKKKKCSTELTIFLFGVLWTETKAT